ncbi:MAG: hypothetical protein ACRD2W_16780 [Acidimicrobiales bacterium]
MRRLAAAAVVLLALAACTGGDALPSLDAKATTTTSQTGTGGTPTSVSSGTANSFCEFLRTYNDRFGRFNAGLADPQQLRTVLNDALAAVKDAEATAPAEIKPDLVTMSRAFQTMVGSFQAAGFDVTKMRLESLGALAAPEFVQASQRIEAYTRQHCL